MLPIILCLFEGLNDLRLVYNDCEKIYFITFVKVEVAIYNDHTVVNHADEHSVLVVCTICFQTEEVQFQVSTI